jgi:hypothetical protein
MVAKQNRHVSTESAAASPLACHLRRQAPVGSLFTTDVDRIATAMSYNTANRNQVVIAMLKELKDMSVIEYIAEKGRGATILVRVLV